MEFDPRWVARYQRQLSLRGFGRQAQEKLAGSHVVVVGAGGLGSPVLLYLAAAGVGALTIIDGDEVSLSNLHRQIIHTTGAIGTPKAVSARETIKALNPDIAVAVINADLDREHARDIFAGADLVIDGTDNLGARYLISWAALRSGIPHIWASILGFDAQISVFGLGDGPIYEDVFPTPPPAGSVPSCAQAGVLGPVVGTVGSAMALEAIKVLTGIGTPLSGRLGYFDALSGEWEYIPVQANARTRETVLSSGPINADTTEEPGDRVTTTAHNIDESCSVDGVWSVDDIPEDAVVIDVREPEEYAEFAIPGALNIPLSTFNRAQAQASTEEKTVAGDTEVAGEEAIARVITTVRAHNPQHPVVIYCAAGKRSTQAIAHLHKAGVTGLGNLRGGIDAWLARQTDEG
ncbi:ThiF family adenylyltransferase [Corynebacterium propinquum]|uniref:ThiF family adenylyltransferase n=1 Tax=Corynebacterium propinquum TaxID=43769 RepID=A0AAP4BU91_9CORY|nr:ThiF family adenylyltransferase [Corynebacterium propinquum]MCG7232257.1 ThiF family adenylyltransferase [Corynebacterium propinquum]MCT1817471.1 ThiF family adenylyltransferase [Corynebacterium propinquum]MDK4251115.1 ThiF family adenylyltransferase [Corynebacterium propinquum]MDK4292361.1 ThiF family adenylyltransferase [Corynebacterium propinquum]MDK4325626.1 ThiF family adenylyltransferase [Corynebacterium propinquum]